MTVIDQLISTASARTDTVRVCARGDLVDQHREIAVQLDAYLTADGDSLGVAPEVLEVRDQLAAIEQRIEDATVDFTLTALPAYRWANILLRCSPTREQREKGYDHDPDEFPPAIVAASVVKPETMSVDQAKALRNALHLAEWNKLWDAALMLNHTETPRPKLAAATEVLLASSSSSTPASPEGSLAEPSSAGGDEQ